MRMGIGLLSLLVVAAILVFAFSRTSIPVAKQGQKAQEQIKPMTGRGPDAGQAKDSVILDPKARGGQTTALVVTAVTPGGYFDHYYKLQKGDEIVQVGETAVETLGDAAEAMVWEAGTRKQALVVTRNGRKVTLAAP